MNRSVYGLNKSIRRGIVLHVVFFLRRKGGKRKFSLGGGARRVVKKKGLSELASKGGGGLPVKYNWVTVQPDAEYNTCFL